MKHGLSLDQKRLQLAKLFIDTLATLNTQKPSKAPDPSLCTGGRKWYHITS